MTKPRAKLGFDDALENFDPTAFKPAKPEPPNDRPDAAAIRKAGEDVGFVSRQPAGKTARPAQGSTRKPRQMTGRSDQVNVRATTEMKLRFQAIAKKQEWSDAVTFEKAVELLEKQYGR